MIIKNTGKMSDMNFNRSQVVAVKREFMYRISVNSRFRPYRKFPHLSITNSATRQGGSINNRASDNDCKWSSNTVNYCVLFVYLQSLSDALL